MPSFQEEGGLALLQDVWIQCHYTLAALLPLLHHPLAVPRMVQTRVTLPSPPRHTANRIAHPTTLDVMRGAHTHSYVK